MLKNVKLIIAGVFLVLSYVVVRNIFVINNAVGFELIDIYFVDIFTNELVAEPRQIPVGDVSSMISVVLTEFMSPPNNISNHMNSIPDSVVIENIMLVDGTDLVLTFSAEYREMTSIQEILGRSALTWTLTGIEQIENLRIYVQDQELLKSTGEPIGNLNRNNVLLNPQVVPAEIEINNRLISLYFGNRDLTGLLLERRIVEISSDRSLAEQILEELLSGSEREGFYSYIPADTRVLDINIIDDIAYVDLSREFNSRSPLGPAAQELAIYSIVNSLTSISGLDIEEVQFLIEAQKLSESSGHFDLSQPFRRNEDLKVDFE